MHGGHGQARAAHGVALAEELLGHGAAALGQAVDDAALGLLEDAGAHHLRQQLARDAIVAIRAGVIGALDVKTGA